MLCTPTGQVSTSLGGETPSTLNMRRLSRLVPARPAISGEGDLERFRANLQEQVVRLTRYQASKNPLHVKRLGQTERKGYRLTHLTYETGPGRMVAAFLAEPDADHALHQAAVYVDENGTKAGANPGGDIDKLAQLGYTVLAVDPSGIGETTVPWSSYSNLWFGQEKITWLALMVGRPLVGLRMDDILRGVDLLQDEGLLYGGKCLAFGKGLAAVDLLHAAVMDGRISGVAAEGGLLSYASIGRSPIHSRIFDAVIPGVLGKYDLPDLVAALAPRPVLLANLHSPVGTPVFLRDARKEYAYAEAAYAAMHAGDKLRIGLRREGESVAAVFPPH